MGDILRQELASPISVELSGVGSQAARRITSSAASKHLLLRSMRDVFAHPEPPIDLLILIKDYAKAHGRGTDPILPPEVASVLYYLSIATAIVYCKKPISTLSQDQVLVGLERLVALDWLDKETNGVLTDRIQRLTASQGEPS